MKEPKRTGRTGLEGAAAVTATRGDSAFVESSPTWSPWTGAAAPSCRALVIKVITIKMSTMDSKLQAAFLLLLLYTKEKGENIDKMKFQIWIDISWVNASFFSSFLLNLHNLIYLFSSEALQQCGFSLSESAASRLHASSPAAWAEMVSRSLLRVFPNGSRVDSSNFSPQEFWNAGVPMG